MTESTADVTCPDPVRWREFLRGALPDPEQTALTTHLDVCDRCQRVMDDLVSGSASWSGAACLGRDQPMETALQQVMASLKADGSRSEGDPAHDEVSLSFLRPPAKPRQLGRLGPYEVIEVIGRGGMGVVLKALDPALRRVVAIKVLAPQLATSATARKRFIREAQAAAQITHEHVVPIHAVDEVDGLPFLVMTYVPGESLQQRLDRQGPLDVREIARIGTQVARGLAAAHAQGLVHRDVKPANILLSVPQPTSDSGQLTVKVTDFGLARAVHDVGLTQSGVLAGTPQYMAPEQARGEAIDHRADLFSLGSVLYVMCTGRPPFRARSTMATLRQVSDEHPRPIQEINPAIPDWLVAVINRLHAKNRADRFQTAAEVADLLERYLAHLQQPGLIPPPLPPRPVPSSVPTPALIVAAAVMLACALTLGGIVAAYLYFSSRPDTTTHVTGSTPGGSQPIQATGPAPAIAVPELRYRWKQGDTHVYRVHIEAEQDEVIETHVGNSIYGVRSVDRGGTILTHSGHLFPIQRPKPGAPPAPGMPRGGALPFGRLGTLDFPTPCEIKVDATGRVLHTNGTIRLPYFLGNFEQLVMEPLESQGKPTWEARRSFTIEETKSSDRMPPFFPLPRPTLGSSSIFRPGTTTSTIPVQEHAGYKIGERDGDNITVHKTYDLKTTDTVAGMPRLHLTGNGQLTFDLEQGVPRKLEFAGQLTENSATTSRRVPLKVTYQLLEGEERERVLNPPPPPKPKPLTDAELTATLAELKSAEPARRRAAAEKLAQAEPKERQAEVAKALESLLTDGDGFTRKAAAQALVIWATPDAVPALIQLLEDKDSPIRHAAIEALAKLKDPRAAEAVARRLPDVGDRGRASQALLAIGPAAEKAVLPYLQHEDTFVRVEACKILKDIGTKDSVPALEKASKDLNRLVSRTAEEALKAISARSP